MNIQINSLLKKICNSKKKTRTRFCPEPSGFLHLGHLKNFYINYYLSKKTKGKINIRIDDSNPNKIKKKFTKNIPIEIFKLGFKKKIKITKTSFYFKRIYKITKKFIKKKIVYIDTQVKEKFYLNKGNYKRTGKNTAFYKRSIKENLYLIKKMNKGIFINGEAIVRLKICMNSKNMNMRDPVIYRIIKNNKNNNIFPTYDYCNSLCDRIEKINYSICSKEFENNRKLYNLIISKYNKIFKKKYKCKQIELSRLNIEGIELQKRKIRNLIKKKYIKNWGDIRLFTLRGMINRGYSNNAIKDIVKYTGFTKTNSKIKKIQIKKIIIKRMSKEIKTAINVVINPIKLISIGKDNLEIFIEKKKILNYIYFFKNLKESFYFFYIKKTKNVFLYIKINFKKKIKKTNFIIKNKKVKKVVLYRILNNKIIKQNGILNKKKIPLKVQIKKIGIFKFINKKKHNPILFEIESFN